MRSKVILGTALAALLLASALTHTVASQSASQLAASSVVTEPSAASPAQSAQATAAAPARLVWYEDPIILAFVVAALFAAIDIAMLIGKQHSHPRKSARA